MPAAFAYHFADMHLEPAAGVLLNAAAARRVAECDVHLSSQSFFANLLGKTLDQI